MCFRCRRALAVYAHSTNINSARIKTHQLTHMHIICIPRVFFYSLDAEFWDLQGFLFILAAHYSVNNMSKGHSYECDHPSEMFCKC